MSEVESKLVPDEDVVENTKNTAEQDNEVEEVEAEDETSNVADASTNTSSTSSKKKGKKKKTTTADDEGESNIMQQEVGKLGKKQVEEIIKKNSSLQAETKGMDPKMIQELLKGMKLEDVLTGMVRIFNPRPLLFFPSFSLSSFFSVNRGVVLYIRKGYSF